MESQKRGSESVETLRYKKAQNLAGMRDNGDVSTLRTFLDAFAASNSKEDKTPLRVSLMGYSNVGKSAVFNSLKRKGVSTVSPQGM